MRSRLPNWIRLGMVLAVIAGTQTGCKSGWKMPGSDMFSWTRKPSESTLAGTGAEQYQTFVAVWPRGHEPLRSASGT